MTDKNPTSLIDENITEYVAEAIADVIVKDKFYCSSEKHKNNHFGKEYKLAIQLIKLHFSKE